MTTTYNVGALLAERAAEHPERDALVMADGAGWARLSFAELHRLSDRYAAGLRDKGVRRGDRTLFLAKPSPDFYAVLFGAIKLGAVPVLVDPGMGLKNVMQCIAEVAPRVVIALPLVHAVRTVWRKPFRSAEILITAGRRWFWGGHTLQQCLGPDEPFEMAPFAADDEVGIVFTSGSTGVPKGVQYTHGIFHAVARLADARLGREAGRHNLETFAAYVLFDVVQGMTSVVPDMDLSKPAQADPAKLVAAIRAFEPEACFASPVVLDKVFAWCEGRDEGLPFADVLSGVAPVPASHHQRLRGLAPGATLHVTYGATEGMTATHVDSDTVLDETQAATARGAGTCVGVPFPDMTVRIVPITDDPIEAWSDDLQLPAGEIGEIVLGGPVVSPRYVERPKANALAKIRDGDRVLHRMGDLGYLDEQGRLWFCGRKSHRLETADGVLPTVPVEHVFDEHPAVRRSALVGLGDAGHERPVLCVLLAPGHAWSDELERDILALAEGTRWAGVVRDAVPTTSFPVDARHNAKIRRGEVRAWVEAHHPDLIPLTKEVA